MIYLILTVNNVTTWLAEIYYESYNFMNFVISNALVKFKASCILLHVDIAINISCGYKFKNHKQFF